MAKRASRSPTRPLCTIALLLATTLRLAHCSNLFTDASHRQDPLVQAVTLRTFNAEHLASFRAQTVFEHGELVSKWRTCSQHRAQSHMCVVFESYHDRVSFLYTFDRARRAEYRLRAPTVSTRSRRADPVVSAYQHRHGRAWFTLLFRCRRDAAREWEQVYDLTVPITDHYSISTTLVKRCTSGIQPPFLELGFLQNDELRKWYLDISYPMLVSASTAVTTLVVRVNQPATAVEYANSTVTVSDDDILSISTRGLTPNGTFVQGDNKLWLLYTCHHSGSAAARLSIDLGAWKQLTVNLNKSCGGSAAAGLFVGTNRRARDVVNNGITQSSFLRTPGNETELFTLPPSKRSLKLFVSNIGLDTLHVGSAHITLHNQSVLQARIYTWRPGELRHGQRRTLRVQATCKQSGVATVQLSLPVLQHRSTELWFRKQCDGPTRSVVPAHFTTTVAFTLIAISFCALRALRARGKVSASGFRRVRRNET